MWTVVILCQRGGQDYSPLDVEAGAGSSELSMGLAGGSGSGGGGVCWAAASGTTLVCEEGSACISVSEALLPPERPSC